MQQLTLHGADPNPGECWTWTRTYQDGHPDKPASFNVVIDAGLKKSLPLDSVTKSKPHVLILTHDDLDHINQAVNMISALPKKVTWPAPPQPPHEADGWPTHQKPEVWLPHDWWVVIQLLSKTIPGSRDRRPGSHDEDRSEATTSPIEITESQQRRLNNLAIEAVTGIPRPDEEEAGAEYLYESAQRGYNLAKPVEPIDGLKDAEPWKEDWWKDLEKILDKHNDRYFSGTYGEPSDDIQEAIDDVRAHADPKRYEPTTSMNKVLTNLVEIYQKIAELRLPVRWFCTETAVHRWHPCWPTEGLPGWVTIINAAQRAPDPIDDVDPVNLRFELFHRAFTTRQNRRALATFLWPSLGPERLDARSWGNDGAIVWSDTIDRVAGRHPCSACVPWEHIAVMSAPHHASAGHEHENIWRHRPEHVYVLLSRNNATSRQSPYWQALQRTHRACSRCAHATNSEIQFTTPYTTLDTFGYDKPGLPVPFTLNTNRTHTPWECTHNN